MTQLSGVVRQYSDVNLTSSSVKDPRDVVKTFWDFMTDKLQEYTDTDSDFTYKGVTVDSSEKTGTLGTALFNMSQTDSTNVIEQIMTMYNNLLSLEKEAARLIG